MKQTSEAVPQQALKTMVTSLAGELPPDFAEFAALFRPSSLEKGEYFARSGEACSHVAFVFSGVARLFYVRGDGKEFIKSFVTPPDFMAAFEAVVTSSPCSLFIQALTPMDVAVAPYSAIAAFYERDILWQRLGRRVAEQLYVKKAQREASLLIQSASERYAVFLRDQGELVSQVADRHIASYLGITPEALSRLKKSDRAGRVRDAAHRNAKK